MCLSEVKHRKETRQRIDWFNSPVIPSSSLATGGSSSSVPTGDVSAAVPSTAGKPVHSEDRCKEMLEESISGDFSGAASCFVESYFLESQ